MYYSSPYGGYKIDWKRQRKGERDRKRVSKLHRAKKKNAPRLWTVSQWGKKLVCEQEGDKLALETVEFTESLLILSWEQWPCIPVCWDRSSIITA